MLIKNLTPNVQELKLRTLGCENGDFNAMICPHGVAEFEQPTILLNAAELEGKISFDKALVVENKSVVESTPAEENVDEDSSSESDVNNEEQSGEEDKTPPEKFICDECKAEFASARGLASHMSRAHQQSEE